MNIVSHDSFLELGIKTTAEIRVGSENLWIGLSIFKCGNKEINNYSIIEGSLKKGGPFVVRINKDLNEMNFDNINSPSIFSALQLMNLARFVSGNGRLNYRMTFTDIELMMKQRSSSPLGDSLHSKYLVYALCVYAATNIRKYSPDKNTVSDSVLLRFINNHLSLAFSVNRNTPSPNRHLVSKARAITSQSKNIFYS